MALTKQDKLDIAAIVSEVRNSREENQRELIDNIKAHVEINTRIFGEISEIGDHIEATARALNNGISKQIFETATKVKSVEFEVNNKAGTLNKLYTKLNYF